MYYVKFKFFKIKFSKKFTEKFYINKISLFKYRTKYIRKFPKTYLFYTNDDTKNTQKYYFSVYNKLILKKIIIYLEMFLFKNNRDKEILNLII